MKRIYTSALAVFAFGQMATAQIMLTQQTPTYTQNFDGMGGGSTATLPANFRAAAGGATIQAVTAYPAAATTTSFAAGNNMSAAATPGLYNFGLGPAALATDRSLGGLIGTNNANVNVFGYFMNNTGKMINSFDLSYQLRKYRRGANTAGVRVQLFYSTNGSTWTNAGVDFRTDFLGGDVDNTGYPDVTTAISPTVVSNKLLLSVGIGNDFYFAWNISAGPSATVVTTSDYAAIGLDAVSVKADIGNVLPSKLTSFNALSLLNGTTQLKWTAENEVDLASYEVLKSQDGQNFKVLTNVAAANRPGQQEYSYFDQSVSDAATYYRLRMVDRNGNSSFSNILALKGRRKTEVLVTPNVIDGGKFNVQINDLPVGKYQLAVYNMNGQQVTTRTIDNNGGAYSDLVLLPSTTPKGYLVMRVIGKDYQYETKLLNR